MQTTAEMPRGLRGRHAGRMYDYEDYVGFRKVIKRLKIFNPGRTKKPAEELLDVKLLWALSLSQTAQI